MSPSRGTGRLSGGQTGRQTDEVKGWMDTCINGHKDRHKRMNKLTERRTDS